MINILFIVISILLICLGFYHIYEQNRYIKDGAKVIAVVENVLVHPTQQEGQTLEEYKKELE
jgi:sulfite exporter TauE/SafE